MIYVYIGGSNRTSDYEAGSLKKSDELQQKVDIASFNLLSGAKPTYNQEVLIYDGITIESQTGAAVVLSQKSDYNKFRVGDSLWLGIGDADEERVTVSAISGTSLTLSSSPSGTFTQGDKIGKKIFGGNVQTVSDENRHLPSNLILKVQCADYTKIFDKKLINDSWKDRSSKYIIVDFLNNFVNYNHEIDSFEYANAAAIQAKWSRGGDAFDTNIDNTNYQEGDTSGLFSWGYSTGTATSTHTFSSINISDLVGVSSGNPTKGFFCFWYKQADYTKASSIQISFGSDGSNYIRLIIPLADNNEWNYARIDLTEALVSGTPNWKAVDYLIMRITETATSQINIDGMRINATDSFTFDNVQDGVIFEDFRASFKKPTGVMQRLADQNGYFWYIDYERDIHFFSTETNVSPFNLNASSDNYFDLKIATDATKIVNRQTVRGATETSSTKTVQDIPGDGVKREWVLRNKFRNLRVLTAINTTAFSTASVGIDHIDGETEYDYFGNYNAQSVRAAATTSTLNTASTIRFRYHEIIPIITQSKDNASITALKNILGNDGIFDGNTITDHNLKTRNEADARAQSEITKFSNPIIQATFVTNYEGLRSGQIINIQDATSGRNINQNFLIQKVSQKPISEYDGINEYSVTCASTVFGIVELLQKLIKDSTNLKVDENEVIYNVETVYEEVTTTESWTVESQNVQRETVSVTESWTSAVLTHPFYWQTTSEDSKLIWNLSAWSTTA